jgi:pyruvate dehydrogenase E2 component (dihydrolipoamide acetyltransferase)
MGAIKEVLVPDIGDFKDVDVIEVLVRPGDAVAPEQSLITVESDKATMEIPAPFAGVVKDLKIKVGDKVSKGTPIASVETNDAAPQKSASPAASAGSAAPPAASPPAAAPAPSAAAPAAAAPAAKAPAPAAERTPPPAALGALSQPAPVPFDASVESAAFKPHASPSVRKFARELGVDLAKVKGTGPKGRITQEDVQGFVKGVMKGPPPAGAPPAAPGTTAATLIALPQIDFAKFGPVEVKPLSRIRRLSGANLHRNWVSIPHVTQFEEADITELEAFRKANSSETEKQGFKLTMVSFLIKASVTALRQFPPFNASLDGGGENLVFKKYYHIGVAVDTPDGLIVPVIRDADRKGVFDLARELADISKRAREKKLKPGDMQGGTFTVSSLGGIGGTAFTPIINAPEVAILGVSKAIMRPVWDGKQFSPRLMLPLSLSYDHRVIDGAAAARFTSYLASVLSDIRRTLL